MSRENAIKFLRDISMGIDYLENAYSTNRQVDPIEDNSLRVTINANIMLNCPFLQMKRVMCGQKFIIFQWIIFCVFT